MIATMTTPTSPEMEAKPEDSLDPVRRLVLTRSRELGLTLADLSRIVGKNATYTHQFMWRGSPKHLPEDVRGLLADALQLSEDDLRGMPLPARSAHPTPSRAPGVPLPPARPVPASAGEVPVFAEGSAVNLTKADDWTVRPPLLSSSGQAFAVWINHDRGRRLSRGDLAFVQGVQTARVGDAVAIMRGPELVSIGDLVEAGKDFAMVAAGGAKATRVKLEEGDRLLKIVAVQFG